MPKVTPAREIAYDAFVDVMEAAKDPNDTIELLLAKNSSELKRIDRNLIKEILFGSLRWYSKIYWIVQQTSKRDLKKASPQIRAALILGTYQIFYMDRVPDRAAVNESVEYIRKKGQAKAVNFVNGILRSIARRSEYFAKPDKDKKPSDFLTLQYSHPKWIVDRWFRRFGFEKTKNILSANNQTPPYSIRINAIKVPTEDIPDFRTELLKEGKGRSDKKPLRSCLKLKNAPVTDKDSLFSKGHYTIQDEASQLIAVLVDPQENEFIIDACSGPGGKTGHLYELSQGKAEVLGIEKDPKQIAKAKETFERLGHEGIQQLQEDFLNYTSEKPIDKILLDAPCSGLGVLRRHPEGKWHKNLSIVTSMAAKQRLLLTHALKQVKVGGEVIFSVCSYESEETLDHLSWLKQEFKDKIEQISPVRKLPDYYKRFVTRENALLIYSGNNDNMDGFGSFIIKKIAEID